MVECKKKLNNNFNNNKPQCNWHYASHELLLTLKLYLRYYFSLFAIRMS